MMNRLPFVAVWVLVACQPKTVELSGRVLEGLDQDAIAADATLQVLAMEDGSLLGETTTDAEGRFAVDVPMDTNVFVRVDDEGAPTTTFAGVVSLFDEALPDGYLFTLPEFDLAAWTAPFDGCPAGDGSGVVAGEVRHYDLATEDGSGAVNISAQVTLLLEDGSELVACYLDDEGEAYQPGALLVGPAAKFAFFGVPAGTHTLDVAYDADISTRQVEQYPVLVLKEASVSPWFPAWVTMPE